MVARIVLAAVALMTSMLGCDPPSAPSPQVPERVVAEHPTARPSSGSKGLSDEGDASAFAAPDVAPQAPPLQTLVPVELPFSDRATIVSPVEDHRSVVLFADEKAEIRRRVAKQLAGTGREVAPVVELERIEAAAATGRLTLEDDQRCRAPLSKREVMTRYFARSPKAAVDALCSSGDCTLQVAVVGPADPNNTVIYSSGWIERPHELRGWTNVKLAPSDIEYASAPRLLRSSHPPPIMFAGPHSIGPWKTDPSRARLAGLEAALVECEHPRVGFHFDVRAAIGSDGRVSRCETVAGHSMAREADGACVCRGVETLRYPSGRKGRRLRAVGRDRGSVSDEGLRPLQPGTDAWVTRLSESLVVSQCVAANDPTKSFAATVVLWLAPDGGIEDVEIFGEVTSPIAMRLSACIVRELPTVPLPCRPPGIQQLQFELSVP